MNVEPIHKNGTKIVSFPFKFYYMKAEEGSEPFVAISVPKKLFKRAVKRNLIRRRIREALRHLRAEHPRLNEMNCLVVYINSEIADYGTIRERLDSILAKIS